MENLLQNIGLTANEAKMYILLLKTGPTATGNLIKKSGFQSSVVYHLLGKLTEQGLASFVHHGGIKHYSACNPSHLRQLLERKEKELSDLKVKLEDELVRLHALRSKSVTSNVHVYTGKKGLMRAFDDVLENASEYYVYGGTGNFGRLIPHYKIYFRREKKLRGIVQKNLLFGKDAGFARPGDTKYLDEKYNLPFSFVIYEGKVLINIFESEPTLSIQIESKALEKAFRKMFDDLWNDST